MGRLGQREGAGQLAGEHRHAVLGDLLRAAAVDDRTQGQAALHADDRGHRAVAAGHLHIDQASGQRAHLLAALDRQAVAQQVGVAQLLDQVQRVVGFVPVLVDVVLDLVEHELAGLGAPGRVSLGQLGEDAGGIDVDPV